MSGDKTLASFLAAVLGVLTVVIGVCVFGIAGLTVFTDGVSNENGLTALAGAVMILFSAPTTIAGSVLCVAAWEMGKPS